MQVDEEVRNVNTSQVNEQTAGNNEARFNIYTICTFKTKMFLIKTKPIVYLLIVRLKKLKLCNNLYLSIEDYFTHKILIVLDVIKLPYKRLSNFYTVPIKEMQTMFLLKLIKKYQ